MPRIVLPPSPPDDFDYPDEPNDPPPSGLGICDNCGQERHLYPSVEQDVCRACLEDGLDRF